MMRHRTEAEVIEEAQDYGHAVIGARVFTSTLGAHQFLLNLGRKDCEIVQFGLSEYLCVLRK